MAKTPSKPRAGGKSKPTTSTRGGPTASRAKSRPQSWISRSAQSGFRKIRGATERAGAVESRNESARSR